MKTTIKIMKVSEDRLDRYWKNLDKRQQSEISLKHV